MAKPAHPLVIAAGRTAIAAVLLFAISPRATVGAIRRAGGKALFAIGGVGLLLAAHFGFFLAGLASTSLPAAVTLVSLEPVAVVLTAWAAFGERPRRGEMLGVALATAGALVLSRGAGHGEHRLIGDLLVVLAVVVYGAYVAAARGLASAMAPGAYATTVYASSALLLAFASAVVGADLDLPRASIAAIVALAIVPTLGGHTIVQWSARHVSPAVVALVSPGETLGSLAIAALMLGQEPSVPELGGAALVLCGVGATIATQARAGAGK